MPVDNSVSVTNGSPTVTGYLTEFVAAEGDIFFLNGSAVPIADRPSTTELTLEFGWPGTNLADQTSWAIADIGDYWRSTITTNKLMTEIAEKIRAGLPMHPDAAGPIADRDDFDDADDGFLYLSTDELVSGQVTPILYARTTATAGVWTNGISIGIAVSSQDPERTVTAAGAITVGVDESRIFVAKTVPAATNAVLPDSLTKNGDVEIIDQTGVWSANNLSLVPNGAQKISGQSGTVAWGLNDYQALRLIPIKTGTGGWIVS